MKKIFTVFVFILVFVFVYSLEINYFLNDNNKKHYREFLQFPNNYEIFPEIYERIYFWIDDFLKNNNNIIEENAIKYFPSKYFIPVISTLEKVKIENFENLELIWEKVDNSSKYLLELFFNDEFFEKYMIDSIYNNYSFDNEFLEPGVYKVRVKALGDGRIYLEGEYSEFSEELVIQKTLEKVLFNHWEERNISWEEVEEALGYFIEIFKNDEKIYSDYTTRKEINLEDISIEPGVYKARVKALGDGRIYLEGEYSEFSEELVISLTLEPPKDIKWDFYFLNWKKVENASKYLMEIYFNNEFVQAVFSYDNNYNFYNIMEKYGHGIYKVKLKSTGDNKVFYDSIYSDYSREFVKSIVLKNPTNLTWKGYQVSWQEVENIYGYVLRIYRNEKEINKLEIPQEINIIDLYSFMKKPGIYTFTLQSVGDNKIYLNSPESLKSNENIRISNLNEPKIKYFNENILEWEKVENASGYMIKIYKNKEFFNSVFFEKEHNKLNLEEYNEGDFYNVSIYALGDNKIFYDSKEIFLLDKKNFINKKYKNLIP